MRLKACWTSGLCAIAVLALPQVQLAGAEDHNASGATTTGGSWYHHMLVRPFHHVLIQKDRVMKALRNAWHEHDLFPGWDGSPSQPDTSASHKQLQRRGNMGWHDRNEYNWYTVGWHDRLGHGKRRLYVVRIFTPASLRGADEGPSGETYHSFRNPVLLPSERRQTTLGILPRPCWQLMAFAEARRHDNRDIGDVTIMMKSRWSQEHKSLIWRKSEWDTDPMRRVWHGVHDGTQGTLTNPTAVTDKNFTYLFFNWNARNYSRKGGETLHDGTVTKKIDSTEEGRRRIFMTMTSNDGEKWTTPTDLTSQVTPPDWGWDVVGPGRGVKTHSGHIIVPAMGRNIIGRGTTGNRTWTYDILDGAGEEGTIIQQPDGRLLRNDKPRRPSEGYRRISRGEGYDREFFDKNNGGFEPFYYDKELPDPGTLGGSMITWSRRDNVVHQTRHGWDLPDPKLNEHRVLFLNSHSKTQEDKLRLRLAYDYCTSNFSIYRDVENNHTDPWRDWWYSESNADRHEEDGLHPDTVVNCRELGWEHGGRADVSRHTTSESDWITIAAEVHFQPKANDAYGQHIHWGIRLRIVNMAWLIREYPRGVMVRDNVPEPVGPRNRFDFKCIYSRPGPGSPNYLPLNRAADGKVIGD